MSSNNNDSSGLSGCIGLFVIAAIILYKCTPSHTPSQTERGWMKTTDNICFYGQMTNDETQYEWTGDSICGVIHGEGKLTAIYKNGKRSKPEHINADYGSITPNDWHKAVNGYFLGKTEDLKPTGFGVLKEKDSRVLIGHFKSGDIQDGTELIHGIKTYQGGFKYGLYHGKGTKYKYGMPIHGTWKEGTVSRTFKEKMTYIFTLDGISKDIISQYDYHAATSEVPNEVRETIATNVKNYFSISKYPAIYWRLIFSNNASRIKHAQSSLLEGTNDYAANAPYSYIIDDEINELVGLRELKEALDFVHTRATWFIILGLIGGILFRRWKKGEWTYLFEVDKYLTIGMTIGLLTGLVFSSLIHDNEEKYLENKITYMTIKKLSAAHHIMNDNDGESIENTQIGKTIKTP